MRVVRLLCITILLVAAVVAQDCSGHGWLNDHSDCVCTSGFSGSLCETSFGADCNPTAAVAKHDKDDRFPVLDETVKKIMFRNNILQLSIASEVVPDRKYNNITFVNGINDKCKLTASSTHASLWSQANDTSCRDNFQLNMPWTDWQDCGFALSATESGSGSSFWQYRATFVISYTDAVGKPFDISDSTYKPDLTRKTAVSYKVYVRFLKNIEIEGYEHVSVNNTIGLKVAITRFDYNPGTMKVTLGISTIVLWPAMLVRDTILLNIVDGSNTTSRISFDSNGNTTAMPNDLAASTDENTVYCTQTKYTNCLQYYEFDIHLDEGCDFNANYVIGGIATTCRDRPSDCTVDHQEAVITISKSDVCGKVTAEPIITGQLQSYDEAHNPQSEFELGYRGYFEVDMQSAQNDFNLTWIDIWVVADMDVPTPADINSVGLQWSQWLYKDAQIQLEGFHDYNKTAFPLGKFTESPVKLIVDDVTRNSNSQVIFTPKFSFIFDAQIFHIPVAVLSFTKGYTLHARGKIVYANNEQYGRKRSNEQNEVVDFVWKVDSAALDSTTRFNLVKKAAASDVQGESNTNTVLITSLVPVAGVALVVVAVAIIAAVVIMKKKKTTSFATLA